MERLKQTDGNEITFLSATEQLYEMKIDISNSCSVVLSRDSSWNVAKMKSSYENKKEDEGVP